MKCEIYGYSDIGGRPSNEDAFKISYKDGALTAVVADGLGAHAKGEVGAAIVMEELVRIGEMTELPADADIIGALQSANKRIADARDNEFQMKSTAVCLYVRGNDAVWAHMGDSRLYHFVNGELVDYTLDHSISQLAVFLGEITREDIPAHSERNRLVHVVGDDEAEPDIKRETLCEGSHAFLLCTDGFWEYFPDKELEATLQTANSPREWIDALRELIPKRAREKSDNNTAAAAFIGHL